MINNKLADKMGVPFSVKQTIEKLHLKRDKILKKMEEKVNFKLYKEWEMNEKKLQKLWGFEINKNYYKFWEVPHCTCPKLDNNDRYPYGLYIINSNCPYHGKEKIK